MRLLYLLVVETSHVQMLDVGLCLLKKLLQLRYWPVTQCFKPVISIPPNLRFTWRGWAFMKKQIAFYRCVLLWVEFP